MSNEWVEVEAKSIDDAIKVGLEELNLQSSTEAEINILREPEGGVFGVGGVKALVRISVRENKGYGDRRKSRSYKKERPRQSQERGRGRPNQGNKREKTKPRRDREYKEADPKEQLEISTTFLKGLLSSFGLEGEVSGRTEDKNLVVEVKGEQTEALVGEKGFIIRSVHELTRTVIQRKSGAGTRLRLDVAGYAEKRKEALTIYAQRLSEQILSDKQEVMLEPMNSVDRKTLHDAATEISGIRSYSEGREPYRSVILAPEEDSQEEE